MSSVLCQQHWLLPYSPSVSAKLETPTFSLAGSNPQRHHHGFLSMSAGPNRRCVDISGCDRNWHYNMLPEYGVDLQWDRISTLLPEQYRSQINCNLWLRGKPLDKPEKEKSRSSDLFGHCKIIHTLLRINLAPAKRIWKMIFLLNCCYRVLGKGTYSHPLKLTAKATEKMMGLDEDPFLSGLVPFRG